MIYPLYEELQKQVNEKNEQNIDISYLCSTINAISYNDDYVDHYEEICCLILHYECVTNANILLTTTPSDGKLLPGNKGFLNFVLKMPIQLRKIILQYIEYYS